MLVTLLGRGSSLGSPPPRESTLTVPLHQGEGLAVPAVLQGRRLHVQVAVDTHRFLLWVGAQLAE